MTAPAPLYFLLLTFPITKAQEPLFNEIYDSEHAPNILRVPGVHRCIRLLDAGTGDDDTLIYSTLYQFSHPDLPHSDAWKAASNLGRWKDLIRPHLASIGRRYGRVVVDYTP